MAQLRDAQTSELIAEGTPIEIVTIAEQIGAQEVLYDGVGGFDPDAVREAHEQHIAGLEAAAAEAPKAEDRKRLAAAAKRERDTVTKAAARAGDAGHRLEAARARLEG